MTKLIHNGKEIEIEDTLEPGVIELDTLDGFPKSNLEDTLQMDFTKSLEEDTVEMNISNLENTLEIPLGDETNE